MWKAAYLHEQMFLQAAQAAQAGDRLVAYARISRLLSEHLRKYSLTVSQLSALVYAQNVLFITRDTNVDFRCDALRIFWVVALCLVLSVGSPGAAESITQPFLRVAERRIGEMVVETRNPAGVLWLQRLPCRAS